MTVNTRDTAVELVEELHGNAICFSYINTMNKKLHYAVFTAVNLVDIYESPFVEDPKLCYDGLGFTGVFDIQKKWIDLRDNAVEKEKGNNA